jgi:N-acetylneuraminate synthase/sialic acid synthase
MVRSLTIGKTTITDASDCYVIAEIGHNHQGSLDKALALITAAASCGANAVKFQKRDNRSLYVKSMYDKPYENENSYGATYGEHREALEFGKAEYEACMHHARELGVDFFATAFDFKSADFLSDFDVPAYKLASGDLKNVPLMKYVAKNEKPMIISTGGATMEDIHRAYDTIMAINPQLCILQCTAAYPAEAEDLHLRVITTFRETFPEATVGLSDHYNGISMAVVAYVLGARVIEKHFTLNHTWKGTDQAFSLEPVGFTKMVRDLQRTRVALGDGTKQILPNETSPLIKMGKSLVPARPLEAGHILTEADIAIKSPGGGVPPYELEKLIGRSLVRRVAVDEMITLSDVKEGSPVAAAAS